MLCFVFVFCFSTQFKTTLTLMEFTIDFLLQFGPILDVEIIFNERGSKVRFPIYWFEFFFFFFILC